MNERENFIRGIVENPFDINQRLVFADWLEEHGEEERGEFIRVQCELATYGKYTCRKGKLAGLPVIRKGKQCSCRWCGLRHREDELLVKNTPLWCIIDSVDSLQQGTIRADFHRGFVEEITCSCEDWLRCGRGIVLAQPVIKVTLTDKKPWLSSANQLYVYFFDFFTTLSSEDVSIDENLLPRIWRKDDAELLNGSSTVQETQDWLSLRVINWARKEAGLFLLEEN